MAVGINRPNYVIGMRSLAGAGVVWAGGSMYVVMTVTGSNIRQSTAAAQAAAQSAAVVAGHP